MFGVDQEALVLLVVMPVEQAGTMVVHCGISDIRL